MAVRNRPISLIHLSWSVFLILFLLPIVATAGQVELLLNASKNAPITTMQEWTRALGTAGVRNFRIQHQAKPSKPTIETRSGVGQKIYLVRGTIDGSGDVLLPGKRFRANDVDRLAEWLDDIAQNGPPAEREPVDKFGLTLSMTKKVAVDLALPVTFETMGDTRASVILQIDKQTRIPILARKSIMATLDKDRVSKELKGFAIGTALAYVVEPFGLGLFPVKNKKGQIEYLIAERSTQKVEPWPIGWKPKNRIKALPELFKTRNINIDQIPIGRIVDKISELLGVPVLIDRAAIAEKRIDMKKKTVSFLNKQTSFDRALSSMLLSVQLKHRLLIDDTGRPFLWITTRAKK